MVYLHWNLKLGAISIKITATVGAVNWPVCLTSLRQNLMSQGRKAKSLSLNANGQTNAVALFIWSKFVYSENCVSVCFVSGIYKKVNFCCAYAHNVENNYVHSLQAQQLFYPTLKKPKNKLLIFIVAL